MCKAEASRWTIPAKPCTDPSPNPAIAIGQNQNTCGQGALFEMKIAQQFLLAMMIACFAHNASADCNSFWHNQKVFYHKSKIEFLRNQCWPAPFLESDVQVTRSPFQIMANNGWRLHHTLSNDVFRPGDSVLTAVGRNRVHWILTQTPPERRYIYVLRGTDADDTSRRVASVHNAMQSVQVSGPAPTVLVTDRLPSLASGEWNTQISRKRREAAPQPALLPSSSGN